MLEVFRMPKAVKITGRTSTVTNSFVNCLIPVVEPSEAEVLEALGILGMTPDDACCAYCGDGHTEWDHLRPIVRNKRPTGYVSEIANLVPCCGKCNQSKSGSDWRDWITGSAKLSPASRRIHDLAQRIERLEAFEKWRTPSSLDFRAAVGEDLWGQYWRRHKELMEAMRGCQLLADRVREAVASSLG